MFLFSPMRSGIYSSDPGKRCLLYNGSMLRRQFLAAAPLLGSMTLFAAKNKIDRHRLSAISDEVGKTPADALAFAHKYNLEKLELRDVPSGKIHYSKLPEADLIAAAKEFR